MAIENNWGFFTIIASLITFVISIFSGVATSSWRLSKLWHRVEKHEEDIKGIGNKVREIDKQMAALISSWSEKVDDLKKTLIEVTTTLKFLQEDLKEVKIDLKRHMEQQKG